MMIGLLITLGYKLMEKVVLNIL